MLKFSDYKLIEYVSKKHGEQKYGDKPYMYHILKVKDVCDKFIDNYEFDEYNKNVIKISVMCHDLLEDTDTEYEELVKIFNEDVAKIVFNVTGVGTNRKQRNLNAYNKIKTDDRSIFVKLCDRISNVEESIKNNERLLKIYKEEYFLFKKNIFNGKFIEMWDYLDKLIN